MASPPTSNQRLEAALCYLFTPVVPIVALRGRVPAPFVSRHARQGLIWAPAFFVLLVLMTWGMIVLIQSDFLFICLLPVVFLVPFLPGAYWAKRVYFGGDVTFPFGSTSRQPD